MNSVFSWSKGRGGGEEENVILECLPPVSIRSISISIALVHALPLSNSLLILSMAIEALLSATPVSHTHYCFETPSKNGLIPGSCAVRPRSIQLLVERSLHFFLLYHSYLCCHRHSLAITQKSSATFESLFSAQFRAKRQGSCFSLSFNK